MGNELFGVDIAGIIDDAISPGLLPAVLGKVNEGTRTAGSPAGGVNATVTPAACRGFIEDYSDGQVDGTNVEMGDRKVILIGDSIAGGVVPEPGDNVTIEGKTFNNIVNVTRDPAAATYVCQVRK